MKHRVVIIGSGFAGLNAAKALKSVDVDVTVIDRRNFHLFQPLLYQVATGALSPGEIAAPIRVVLRRNQNTKVLLGDAVNIDVTARKVILGDGGVVDYDTLIVAAGSTDNYFKHPEWAPLAPGLKSVENATEIRRRILIAFENAERTTDPEKRKAFLTFAIIGGGATGVEMAGAISEIAHDTLKHDFRSINPKESQIILIEGSQRLLSSYPEDLSQRAEEQLEKLGVMTIKKSMVTEIEPGSITIHEDTGDRRIATETVIWGAGVKASPLGKILADQTGAELDKSGRPLVEPDCSLRGHPEILVIGDMAHLEQNGKPLPGVAQTGIQMGEYAAKLVAARSRGETYKNFHYFDKGNMATIGRAAAVAEIGKLHFSGLAAWLLWLFIHLMYLVGFQNRVVVIVQWFYAYATFNRGARLITGTPGEISPAKVSV